MTIDLNAALVFVAGVAFTAAVFKLTSVIAKWVRELRRDLSAITELAFKLDLASAKLDSNTGVMLKAATDSDLSANSIAKSAVQLQLLIDDMKQIMMTESPSLQQAVAPTSFMTMQNSFEEIEKELLAQGIDPEIAKFKAADYELNRLADGGDLSEVSMSL